jgi:hypothetical protein
VFTSAGSVEGILLEKILGLSRKKSLYNQKPFAAICLIAPDFSRPSMELKDSAVLTPTSPRAIHSWVYVWECR